MTRVAAETVMLIILLSWSSRVGLRLDDQKKLLSEGTYLEPTLDVARSLPTKHDLAMLFGCGPRQ